MTSSDASPFIRAFIALEINDEVRKNLEPIRETLKQTQAHVSWTPPENVHLSLAFLGNITTDTADLVGAALDDIAEQAQPFSFDVMNIGAFGGKRSPRVVWAGVDNAAPLQPLHRQVADALKALELKTEDRAYTPHLTLGRVRSARGRDDLVKALENIGDVFFGHVDVSRIVLMKSALKSSGAEYSVLHAAGLEGSLS